MGSTRIHEVQTDSLSVKKLAFLWLSRADLKAEAGSIIISTQYQALQTMHYAKSIVTQKPIVKASCAKDMAR
jgi:hypothetical protein